MYNKQKDYVKEKEAYQKTTEMNKEDPEGYYYLSLWYINQNNIFKSISYLTKSITKLSADNDYYITSLDGFGRVELEDLYLQRAEVYKNADEPELMCEDYKNACDLGDCELFNTNCK